MIPVAGGSVALREFREDDSEAVYEVIGDARVTYWLSFDSRPQKAAEDMIDAAIERSKFKPRTEYYLAIADANTDALVGFIRLALTGVRAAKLGYAIRSDSWGRGYATEAVRMILRLAFDELNLHRVTAAIGPDNARSISLVEKFSFKYEGRLRDHVYTNESWRDSLLYSVLVSEWQMSAE